jgi:hypothetical protein
MQGKPCPACGWRPKTRGADIEVIDDDLVAVPRDRVARKAEPTALEKRRFHGELIWIARERSYADGWVSNKYREKFGSWPRGDASMAEPRPETRSWIRSRQIAYAKAMAKAAA